MKFDPGDKNQNSSFPPNTVPLENQVAGHSFGDGKNTLGNSFFVFIPIIVFNTVTAGIFKVKTKRLCVEDYGNMCSLEVKLNLLGHETIYDLRKYPVWEFIVAVYSCLIMTIDSIEIL